MKILEFIQGSNGQFSGSRLFSLLVIMATIIDWMHAVFTGDGVWVPDWQNIGMVFGVLGLKYAHKSKEEK